MTILCRVGGGSIKLLFHQSKRCGGSQHDDSRKVETRIKNRDLKKIKERSSTSQFSTWHGSSFGEDMFVSSLTLVQ